MIEVFTLGFKIVDCLVKWWMSSWRRWLKKFKTVIEVFNLGFKIVDCQVQWWMESWRRWWKKYSEAYFMTFKEQNDEADEIVSSKKRKVKEDYNI